MMDEAGDVRTPAERHAARARIARDALAWLSLAVCIALFWIDLAKNVPQQDDAYISYRYAANLLAGKGLVFNAGEYVEGYTNLLWTLLVALFMRLGGDAPRIGLWLSLVFGSLSLAAVTGYTACLLPPQRRAWAALAPVTLLCANSFAAWTTGGLETPLFLFLVVTACWAESLSLRWPAASLCMLSFATRPEGALLAACLLGPNLIVTLRQIGWRQIAPVARAAGPALAFSIFVIGMTAFRLYYYGDVFPNTAYAKIGSVPIGRGLSYVVNFAADGPGVLLPLATIAALRLERYRPAFLYCVVTIAYVIAIGGDIFFYGRFLLAPLALLLAGAIAAAGRMGRPRRAAGAGLMIILSCLWSLMIRWPSEPLAFSGPLSSLDWTPRFAHFSPAALTTKRAAAETHFFPFPEDPIVKGQLEAFAKLTPPVRVVAAIGIGRLGYFGQNIRIIDMVGLVDRHIARSRRVIANSFIAPGHSHTDAGYVLSQKPDAIIAPKRGMQQYFVFPAVLDLWQNPELDKYYQYDEILDAYVRRSSSNGSR